MHVEFQRLILSNTIFIEYSLIINQNCLDLCSTLHRFIFDSLTFIRFNYIRISCVHVMGYGFHYWMSLEWLKLMNRIIFNSCFQMCLSVGILMKCLNKANDLFPWYSKHLIRLQAHLKRLHIILQKF